MLDLSVGSVALGENCSAMEGSSWTIDSAPFLFTLPRPLGKPPAPWKCGCLPSLQKLKGGTSVPVRLPRVPTVWGKLKSSHFCNITEATTGGGYIFPRGCQGEFSLLLRKTNLNKLRLERYLSSARHTYTQMQAGNVVHIHTGRQHTHT